MPETLKRAPSPPIGSPGIEQVIKIAPAGG